METLVLANQKGGVGKSAFAVQFAHYLHTQNLRVLVIDQDHQGNTSKPLKLSGKVTVSSKTSTSILTTKTTEIEDGAFVLVPADNGLMDLEREKQNHNTYASNLHAFISSVQDRFDCCIIDTNPNPDIRLISALVVANYVLSPIELNQEAIDGIYLLLKHERVGIEKMQRTLNKNLKFIGILPNKVESTPFHKHNFTQLAESGYAKYLIKPNPDDTQFAYIQLRSVIAEAQADGCPIWEVKTKGKDGNPITDSKGNPVSTVKTAARETWREIKPFFKLIANKMGLEV